MELSLFIFVVFKLPPTADDPVTRDKFPLHGTGKGKCGNKLLLNCLPAQPVPIYR